VGGAEGYHDEDLTAADITMALQLVERAKFQPMPSLAVLRTDVAERWANLRGDDAARGGGGGGGKAGRAGSDLFEDPLGDRNR
jgi:hypothetical protein